MNEVVISIIGLFFILIIVTILSERKRPSKNTMVIHKDTNNVKDLPSAKVIPISNYKQTPANSVKRVLILSTLKDYIASSEITIGLYRDKLKSFIKDLKTYDIKINESLVNMYDESIKDLNNKLNDLSFVESMDYETIESYNHKYKFYLNKISTEINRVQTEFNKAVEHDIVVNKYMKNLHVLRTMAFDIFPKTPYPYKDLLDDLYHQVYNTKKENYYKIYDDVCKLVKAYTKIINWKKS